jgi:hypothetical protein
VLNDLAAEIAGEHVDEPAGIGHGSVSQQHRRWRRRGVEADAVASEATAPA